MMYSETKELSVVELTEKLKSERAELTRMKLNHAISPMENPLQIKVIRRNIAKLLTAKGQKQSTVKQ